MWKTQDLLSLEMGLGSLKNYTNSLSGLEWSASSTNRMSWDDAEKYAEKLEVPVYYRKGE